MVVVPLVVASIIVGVSGVAQDSAFGRLGCKTILYYLFTSTIAIFTGLFLVNLIEPGGTGEILRNTLSNTDATEFMQKVEGRSMSDITDIFLRMIPANIFHAASTGQLLGLIFFSAVFGFFMTHIKGEFGETLSSFWNSVQEVMLKMTMWIMRFAPLGVFALVSKTLIQTGFWCIHPSA